MAFAFQLLLTNFGVAAGITALGYLPSLNSEEQKPHSAGNTVGIVGFALGLGTLLTINTVLFLSCFLAVKLSLVTSPALGAITGTVIWSAYFLILVWLSSRMLGSFIGSVVNAAVSGFQSIAAMASKAFRSQPETGQIASNPAEAIRNELREALNSTDIQEIVENYLENLNPPRLDLQEIHSQLEKLVNNSELIALTESKIDRRTLENLIDRRADFSKQEFQQIIDQLESVWQGGLRQQPNRTLGTKLLEFLRSAELEVLKSGELSGKLEQLVAQELGQSEPTAAGITQAPQIDFKAILKAVLSRVDLSELDVEKVLRQLRTFQSSLTGQAAEADKQTAVSSSNTIRTDVEDYLLNAYPWHLTRKTVQLEFEDILYDSEAAPAAIRQQLEQLNRDCLVSTLETRADLTAPKIAKIADRLEEVRLKVLSTVRVAELEEQSKILSQRLEHQLHSLPKAELQPENIEGELRMLLETTEMDANQFLQWLEQLDGAHIQQLAEAHQALDPQEVQQLTHQLGIARDRLLAEALEAQEQAKSQAKALWHQVETYLSEPNNKLTAKDIKRTLRALFKDSLPQLNRWQERSLKFDQNALLSLLKAREDLSDKQIQRITSQFEKIWGDLLTNASKSMVKAKHSSEQLTTQLAQHLQSSDPLELDADTLQRVLSQFLDHSSGGRAALGQQLSQLDWQGLVSQLRQRQDWSEAQVQQVVEQVQGAARALSRAPRRWARRSQAVLSDFQTKLEDYLRSTDKAELDPEAIKRDLKLLLNDPQAGLDSLGDRLSQLDRSTWVALLAQRDDLTEAEAEQLVAQLESAREQLVAQFQAAQHQMQAVIEGSLAKVRQYFNSLERPELNYDGLKRDLRKLLGDPQAGFEALSTRLSQFDRETLAAVLSSRDDIPESVANRLIDQVEGVRANLLQRVEHLQQSAQRRLEALTQQAQQQAQAAQTAAAVAAWWLFGTALTSLASSAVAGVLATSGLAGLRRLLPGSE